MRNFTDYTQLNWFQNQMVEALSTNEIDPDQFPNPITQAIQRIFTSKGKLDGEVKDDVVSTTRISTAAVSLSPSQSEIFLGKSLGMAVGGVRGGDLGAIVSKDNRILDGHHRWAATMFSEPKAKIGGLKADLKIGDLVPVLRALGDAFGNNRRGMPKGGDINIYEASIEDAMEAINNGKFMNPKFYSKIKSVEWLESIGGEKVLQKRLNDIQSKTAPSGAPMRSDMPVIDSDKKQHVRAAGLLSKGRLDVRKPYAK